MEETLQQTGKGLEAEGETAKAIALYEKEIGKASIDIFPYQRLIIIYHKQKDYREELRILKKGIDMLTRSLKEKQDKVFGGKPKRRSLLDLSKKMAQRMGLLDRKGEQLLLPEPLNKWLTRKKMVERKLKQTRAKKSKP
jgi:tetratricopeptide (TPR) repeat protein